jgi:predicted DNA-binding protein (UPF0251 family)
MKTTTRKRKPQHRNEQTYEDGKGWDALANLLTSRIRTMRAITAATREPRSIDFVRNDGGDTDGGVFTHEAVSIAAMGFDPTFEDVCDWERWEAVNRALDEVAFIHPTDAEIMRRLYGIGRDEQTASDIAREFGVSRMAVWHRFERAKWKLAEILKGYGKEMGL